MSKKYCVVVPFTGAISVMVEADNEDMAIEKALEVEVTSDNVIDMTYHTNITDIDDIEYIDVVFTEVP